MFPHLEGNLSLGKEQDWYQLMIPELESSTELALLKNRAFGKIAPKANKEAPASTKAEAKALKAKVESKGINKHTHTHIPA